MNKQSGFTLIEIVMVLVLLGILSAVAVPKYFDLQAQAQQRAAQAAVAEAQARVNALFAEALLKGESCSNAVKEIQKSTSDILSDTVNGKDMSGWTVTWTADDNVTQTGKAITATITKDNKAVEVKGWSPAIVVPGCNVLDNTTSNNPPATE